MFLTQRFTINEVNFLNQARFTHKNIYHQVLDNFFNSSLHADDNSSVSWLRGILQFNLVTIFLSCV